MALSEGWIWSGSGKDCSQLCQKCLASQPFQRPDLVTSTDLGGKCCWKCGVDPFRLHPPYRGYFLEILPRQWQQFNGAWQAAFSSLACNHLWGNLSQELNGYADSLPGTLTPMAKAGLCLHEDCALKSIAQGCVSGPVLRCRSWALQSSRLQRTGWFESHLLSSMHRVPAKATGDRSKFMNKRLSPKLCFWGYNLTSGLRGSQGPHSY